MWALHLHTIAQQSLSIHSLASTVVSSGVYGGKGPKALAFKRLDHKVKALLQLKLWRIISPQLRLLSGVHEAVGGHAHD